MKFITDANIPKALVHTLQSEKFDVVDIRDFLPVDAADDEVYAEALRQQRTIISSEKHFGNLLLYPLEKHYGVIILRTKGLNTEEMTEILLRHLRDIGDTDYKGILYVLENKKYRKRIQ